jgi:hypothetical protein
LAGPDEPQIGNRIKFEGIEYLRKRILVDIYKKKIIGQVLMRIHQGYRKIYYQ